MSLGPLPNWTLDEYGRECAGLMNVKIFDAMAVDGENLVIYDKSRFERDSTLNTWKKRWAVLSRWRVELLMDARFVDVLFVLCEQKSPYSHRLQDDINANMDVAVEDLEIQCWLIDMPHTNMYLMRGGKHRTKVAESKICQGTAVPSSIFVRWQNLKMFAVPPKDCYWHHVSVPTFWQYWEGPRILCVPSPPTHE